MRPQRGYHSERLIPSEPKTRLRRRQTQNPNNVKYKPKFSDIFTQSATHSHERKSNLSPPPIKLHDTSLFSYRRVLLPVALGPKHDNKPTKKKPFGGPDLLIPFLGDDDGV